MHGGKYMKHYIEKARKASENNSEIKPFLMKGVKPIFHMYTTVDNVFIYGKIRCKLVTGKKLIRPFYFSSDKLIWKQPALDGQLPLYNLHNLSLFKGETVIICEGEACVDLFTKQGIIATTSGSATSAAGADWSPLYNLPVIIWPDNDEAGKQYAQAVAQILFNAGNKNVSIIDISYLNLNEKQDAVDWFVKCPHATKNDVLALPQIKYIVQEQEASDHQKENKHEKNNFSSELVKFVRTVANLFHDPNKKGYVQLNKNGRVIPIDSQKFKDWLSAEFFILHESVIREQTIREVQYTLHGLSRQAECHEVYIRTAKVQDAYYLDLCEENNNKAICIKPDKWEVIENPPVRFLRSESMLALPVPISGGNILELPKYVNIAQDDILLVVTWLCDALRIDTPFSILQIIGEQGSAKTTTQNTLRKIIDPNICNSRVSPKKREDIFVSAGLNCIISYENISYFKSDMQDAFCVLSTGGGEAKRKLHTDSDEVIIKVKRAVMLNGIGQFITADDLVDRTICIELPRLQCRKKITNVDEQFSQVHHLILGGLLDVFAKALVILPTLSLPEANMPRLIEYYTLGAAIAIALNKEPETFFHQYEKNHRILIERALEASPIIVALIDYMEIQDLHLINTSLKALLEDLERFHNFSSSSYQNWPRSPKGFGDALRKATPSLRYIGIECRSLGKQSGRYHWEIKRIK